VFHVLAVAVGNRTKQAALLADLVVVVTAIALHITQESRVKVIAVVEETRILPVALLLLVPVVAVVERAALVVTQEPEHPAKPAILLAHQLPTLVHTEMVAVVDPLTQEMVVVATLSVSAAMVRQELLLLPTGLDE
jgi:hypothetical protein